MNNLLQQIDVLKKELESLQPIEAEFQRKLDRKFRLEFNYNLIECSLNSEHYPQTHLSSRNPLFQRRAPDHPLLTSIILPERASHFLMASSGRMIDVRVGRAPYPADKAAGYKMLDVI